jgi:hypothetical protein
VRQAGSQFSQVWNGWPNSICVNGLYQRLIGAAPVLGADDRGPQEHQPRHEIGAAPVSGAENTGAAGGADGRRTAGRPLMLTFQSGSSSGSDP